MVSHSSLLGVLCVVLACVLSLHAATQAEHGCTCSDTGATIETCDCLWDGKLGPLGTLDLNVTFDVNRTAATIGNLDFQIDGKTIIHLDDYTPVDDVKGCVPFKFCKDLCIAIDHANVTANGLCGDWEFEADCLGWKPSFRLFKFSVGTDGDCTPTSVSKTAPRMTLA
eukprot:TRINITY_DN6707_c0_g1_i1.p1 TRINITY_DN6707_c0_g1~~TRINITY_DN6707_c0_g1_i1.p1  ORF type:complete len:180 (-),score=30.32 TRINITY_DN6707_c0_g1_i1:18-521(-)